MPSLYYTIRNLENDSVEGHIRKITSMNAADSYTVDDLDFRFCDFSDADIDKLRDTLSRNNK